MLAGEEMSGELAKAKAPSLRERSKLVLNCGNIASWSKLKKRAILTSTEEVSSWAHVRYAAPNLY